MHVVLTGFIAGLVFALARGFVQAALDDWRVWRARNDDIVVHNRDLQADEQFLDELEAAVQRSFSRR